MRSPYSGDVVGRVAKAGAAEAKARGRRSGAGDGASRFRRTSAPRSSSRPSRESRRRHDEIAAQISAEAGKPLKAAKVEASRAMSTYTFAAVEARKLAGEVVPMDAAQAGEGKLAFTLREPIGIVGAISPFNFPLNLVAHKIAPALAAGCAVVLKPAGQTPLSALTLAELEDEAGLPPGWLNVLVGPASEIGDVLVEDERVQGDHLHRLVRGRVGHPRARGAEEGAARARKRDARDRRTATPISPRRLRSWRRTPSPSRGRAVSRSSGSTCRSAVYDEFVAGFVPKVEELVVGDPAEADTDVGPVIDEGARERILTWIAEARDGGAEVLAGGDLDGDLIRPTVIANAAPDMKVCREEVFGPVVRRQPYESLDEAIALANGTRYGLQAGIFTADFAPRCGRPQPRVRRRDRQRGADVPLRPDALRRRQGFGQHARGTGLLGARADRAARRRDRPVAPGRGSRPAL